MCAYIAGPSCSRLSCTGGRQRGKSRPTAVKASSVSLPRPRFCRRSLLASAVSDVVVANVLGVRRVVKQQGSRQEEKTTRSEQHHNTVFALLFRSREPRARVRSFVNFYPRKSGRRPSFSFSLYLGTKYTSANFTSHLRDTRKESALIE